MPECVCVLCCVDKERAVCECVHVDRFTGRQRKPAALLLLYKKADRVTKDQRHLCQCLHVYFARTRTTTRMHAQRQLPHPAKHL